MVCRARRSEVETVNDVRFVTPTTVERHPLGDVTSLLGREDGFVWLDLPRCGEEDARLLRQVFGCHPLAVAACLERNTVPTMHRYPESVFVIVHTPEPGEVGHVHLLELDTFIGRRFLVTVHGPLNPAVPLDAALTETRAVLERIERGRFHPHSPAELSYAIASAVARRQRTAIDAVARKVAALERRVMTSDFRSPEDLLHDMFLVRHELLTVRTMAAQTHDVHARLGRLVSEDDKAYATDLADQFDRVRSVSDGEKEFLFGVIDLYTSRVTTKMTVAMERLAVLAAVTLPITAIASVYGMNVIVNERTHMVQLMLVLAVMAVISAMLLRWTKRQGWW
jgi:magnesium transporter